ANASGTSSPPPAVTMSMLAPSLKPGSLFCQSQLNETYVVPGGIGIAISLTPPARGRGIGPPAGRPKPPPGPFESISANPAPNTGRPPPPAPMNLVAMFPAPPAPFHETPSGSPPAPIGDGNGTQPGPASKLTCAKAGTAATRNAKSARERLI